MNRQNNFLPFLLSFFVVAADQITKCIIVRLIPEFHIGFSCMDGFFRIVHARNTAIAFSMGDSISPVFKTILFCIVPLIVLILMSVYAFRAKELNHVQRWCLAGIVGGGFGNLIDRFFRPAGVVDFLDVKFYGLFGLERWPTFNVADMAIVICGIVLVFSFLVSKKSK